MANLNSLTGAKGMVKVIYNLNDASESMWYAGGKSYRFGGNRKEGYVAIEAWPELNELWEGGVKVFQLAPDQEEAGGPAVEEKTAVKSGTGSAGASSLIVHDGPIESGSHNDNAPVALGMVQTLDEPPGELDEEEVYLSVDLSGNLEDLEARLAEYDYSMRALEEALEKEIRKGGQALLQEAIENWLPS